MIGTVDVAGIGRPNVFEVDLGAVAANVRVIRDIVGSAWLCPALKADAYGFGLVEVAHAALEAGADALAVGDVGEGLRLRRAGMRAPVLVYAGAPLDVPSAEACRDYDLIATVHDAPSLDACLAHGRGRLQVFIEVDSGLQRLGFAPAEVPAALDRIAAGPGVDLAGIYTHLHVPESPADAEAAVPAQFSLFLEAAAAAPPGVMRMAASSRVLARFPTMVLDAVDPGRAVYGLPWAGDDELRSRLRPAFAALRTKLLQVKPAGPGPYAAAGRRLGVIPIGRRDGLPLLSCGEVLVRGHRAPLVGPPSLEHSRIDLEGVANAEPGDEVVLVGRQGAAEITAVEVLDARPELASTALALQVGSSIRRRYLS